MPDLFRAIPVHGRSVKEHVIPTDNYIDSLSGSVIASEAKQSPARGRGIASSLCSPQ
jgi:hypothetical protein